MESEHYVVAEHEVHDKCHVIVVCKKSWILYASSETILLTKLKSTSLFKAYFHQLTKSF